MSSVWTFRLKRRKRFSIDSPSCDRTSAKSASRNAVTRCVSSVPYKAWPDTLQPIHRSFCNEHPYVHGNELRTASMTTTDAGMYSCAGLSRRYFTTVRTAWFVETLDGTQGMVHQRCFFVFFQHLHGTVHVMNAHDVTDAQRSPAASVDDSVSPSGTRIAKEHFFSKLFPSPCQSSCAVRHPLKARTKMLNRSVRIP